jgi:hypothetical protein
VGLFDIFRRKKGGGQEPPAPEPDDAQDEGVLVGVAVVREGMSLPTDEEMRALVGRHAPEAAELPCVGLSQPVWWRQAEWVSGGMRAVARALAARIDNDPSLATHELCKDDRGARVGIVLLRAARGGD